MLHVFELNVENPTFAKLTSVRLFTSDTNWLVPTEHASGSHVFYLRPL